MATVVDLMETQIKESIISHDKKFQELLCMIPAKYYIPQHLNSSQDNTYQDELSTTKIKRNKQKKKQQRAVGTEEEEQEAESRRAQKRTKYDPDSLPTIPQLQGLNNHSKKPGLNQQHSLESSNEDESEQEDEPQDKSKPRVQLSRTELQAKLQQKIDQLQKNSTTKKPTDDGDEAAGTTSKDSLLELGRKKRGEMRDRRRRERKEARRKEKQAKEEQILLAKKKKGKLVINNKTQTSGSGNLKKNEDREDGKGVDGGQKGSEQMPTDTSDEPETCTSNDKRLVSRENQEPNLAFSSLSFEVGGFSNLEETSNEKKKNPSWTSKNPKEAKIALERREAYLEKLTPEARERSEEKKKWEKANLEISGMKVKDDKKKLEKTIKRIEREKNKKKIIWNERNRDLEHKQVERQAKRQENIEKRKEIIKDKKMKKQTKNKNKSGGGLGGGGKKISSVSKGIKAKGNSKNNNHESKTKKSVKGF